MNLYLLKANICLSIFTMIYWAFLRNNTFYKINRIYFVLVMLISAILPLLNLSDFVNQQSEITQYEIVKSLPDLSLSSQNQTVIVNSSQNIIPVHPTISINIQDIFEAIYVSGIVIFLCKLIVQIVSIFRIYRQSKLVNISGITIRNLEENISPFSFFKLIFINIKQHSESDLAEIITHERTHATKGHSYDVILAELFCIAFWINPLAWILRKFLKQNLEFLTDKTVLQSGFNARNYQFNLLKINGLNISSVSNNFNLSDLKMRIKMMNRKRSSNLHLVKYSLMIPFGAVLILVFNITKAKPFDAQKSVLQNLKETAEAVEFVSSSAEKKVSNIDKNILLKNIDFTADYYVENQSNSNTRDSTKKTWNYQTADIKITDKTTRQGIKGIKIFDDKGKLLGTTNFQGICLFDYPKPFKEIARDSFKMEGKSFKMADYFHKIVLLLENLQKAEFVFKNFQKSTHMTFCDGIFEIQRTMKIDSFIVDNKQSKTNEVMTNSFNENMKKHRSLSYLRSDGSVWIEPKTKWFYCKEDMIKELKQSQELPEDKRPVYMTNGKVVATDYKFEELSIHSVVNLKYWNPEDGEKMSGKYGKQAKNGMYDLMVLEKTVLPKREYKDVLYTTDYVPTKVERCTPSPDFPTNATYIVDGKEVDSGYLHKNVKPEDIVSLKVLQPEKLPTKEDKKGKKGVILISTKKNDKLH
jgi:beta-lactamase regulating signal transducer with metallopeptidase domain